MIRYLPKTFVRNDDKERFVYHDGGYVNEKTLREFPNNVSHLHTFEMLSDPTRYGTFFHVEEKDGYVLDEASMGKEDLHNLIQLAENARKHIETKFSRRGWTTGMKKWEQELLFLSYEALGVKMEDRKFGLNKIETLGKIQKKFC